MWIFNSYTLYIYVSRRRHNYKGWKFTMKKDFVCVSSSFLLAASPGKKFARKVSFLLCVICCSFICESLLLSNFNTLSVCALKRERERQLHKVFASAPLALDCCSMCVLCVCVCVCVSRGVHVCADQNFLMLLDRETSTRQILYIGHQLFYTLYIISTNWFSHICNSRRKIWSCRFPI